MKRMRRILAGVILLLAMAGCGDEGPATYVSYNAALAHGAVAFAKERRPLLIDALAKVDAEVVCLQEVWTDDDAKALIDGLSARFPHSFREATKAKPIGDVACTDVNAVLKLQSCVNDKCTAKGISVFECVDDPCKTEYAAIKDPCKRCLAANTSQPAKCALLSATDKAFDGRNGLLLLSSLPIEDAAYHAQKTAIIERGMISATIGGVKVLCTHMSAGLKAVPYPSGLPAKSFEDEHQLAVEAAIDAAGDGCTVLVGDFNAGPAVAGLTAVRASGYKRLQDAGYQESWSSPRCTFCSDNQLAGVKQGRWIDHIMTRGCGEGGSYQRLLDQPVTLTASGKSQNTRLSDHYGLHYTAP